MLAVASEGGHLLSLLLQPLCDLRLLLWWDLLASSLQPISQLIQASVCVLGFQESLTDMRDKLKLSSSEREDKTQDREMPKGSAAEETLKLLGPA